ncbi:MAG: ABC transporter substrate-binding protein [Candidatus Sulfotelmatobacter sp.]
MKRFAWQWRAASKVLVTSLLLQAGLIQAGAAETRPQYGGTVRIAMRGAPVSLDPSLDLRSPSEAGAQARRNLLALIFETLVTLDDRGRIHAGLATDWQAAPGNQRWQFHLRQGVKFHDGSPLTADIAASSLRMANPSWKVFAEGDSIIVERDHGDFNLPAELALACNSIVKKDSGGKLSGTGPFRIADWQSGKKLTLKAEEDYWRGRAFIDTIEVEMGRNFHDQLAEMEMRRADLVEVAPEQGHQAGMEGHRLSTSQPMEVVALVFRDAPKTADEKLLRSALAHSVERGSMKSVLLQGTGEPTASLLPNWMSGYGFVFPTDADLKQARHERQQVRGAPSWTVGYDANDSLARVLVERIALNAKDAGLVLQPSVLQTSVSRTSALPALGASAADLRLVRIPLASTDPWIALANAAESLGMAMPASSGNTLEDLYAFEKFLLAQQKVIPLFHLPVEYAVSPALKDWRPAADGSWRLDEVWLGNDKP